MVHTGNVYFERCYGAEFDDKVSPEEREACWNAWLADYTRHQPAHRIDYAMRRLEGIQAGDGTLRLPGISAGPTSAPTDPTIDERMKLRTARVGADVATLERRESDAGGIPHGCDSVCREYAQRCQQQCPPEAPDCSALCIRDGAICSQGCY
jgi:hypothetical protein